jgi:hypothetical protein
MNLLVNLFEYVMWWTCWCYEYLFTYRIVLEGFSWGFPLLDCERSLVAFEENRKSETLVISPRCVLYNGARATLINGTIDDRCSTCISRSSNSSSCSRTGNFSHHFSFFILYILLNHGVLIRFTTGILDLQISNSETATAATKGSLKKVFDPWTLIYLSHCNLFSMLQALLFFFVALTIWINVNGSVWSWNSCSRIEALSLTNF